jgi:NarL family two-component system response regulator LiaR
VKAAVKTKLLLVDDHDAVVIGWKDLLERSGHHAVVATASSGEQAIPLVSKHKPDVCLIDLRLPGLAGPALIRELLRVSPDTRVVVLTVYGERKDIAACMGAGAAAYLSKDSSSADLAAALSAVLAGKYVLDFGGEVLPLLARPPEDAQGHPEAGPLTEREADVLRRVADGLSNQEIAEALGISAQTVKNRLRLLMSKLGAPNRTAAAMIARDEGLL